MSARVAPWDFSVPPAKGDPSFPNLPTPEGRLLGAELARLCDIEEERVREYFPNHHPRCDDCALRAGTDPNGCPETLMDVVKAVMEAKLLPQGREGRAGPAESVRRIRDPHGRLPRYRDGTEMNAREGHGLLLAFDRYDPLFAMGFECGRIWALLRGSEDELSATMHAENAEMAIRLAEATGRTAQSEEVGNGWIEVSFPAPDTERGQQ